MRITSSVTIHRGFVTIHVLQFKRTLQASTFNYELGLPMRILFAVSRHLACTESLGRDMQIQLTRYCISVNHKRLLPIVLWGHVPEVNSHTQLADHAIL